MNQMTAVIHMIAIRSGASPPTRSTERLPLHAKMNCCAFNLAAWNSRALADATSTSAVGACAFAG